MNARKATLTLGMMAGLFASSWPLVSAQDGHDLAIREGYELVGDEILPTESRAHFTGSPWPGGVVPYAFDPAWNPWLRESIEASMFHYELAAGIDFVPWTGQANYVYIVQSDDPTFCGASYVGMVGGRQDLWLRCIGDPIVLHEFGHALGMRHEQQRPDRDTFITVNYSNIAPANWKQFNIAAGNPFGGYDFESIMHYREKALAIDPSIPTMVAHPAYATYQNKMGKYQKLSSKDKDNMIHFYGSSIYGPVRWTPYLKVDMVAGQPVAPLMAEVWNEGSGPVDYHLENPTGWMTATNSTGTATQVPTQHAIHIDETVATFGRQIMSLNVIRSHDGQVLGNIGVDIQVYLHVADPTFRAYVLDAFDADLNGQISQNEIYPVTSLDLSDMGIEDLTGLAGFENLTHLDASRNAITSSRPVWDNPTLTNDEDCSHYIDLSGNALDIFANDAYCYLHCRPIGFVDTSDQLGAEHAIECRCFASGCRDVD